MRLPFQRDFCVWVVPPNDGKVRKVRFTLKLAAVAMLILGSVGALFAFIASDYTRVQILRAKHYLMLRSVSQERDKLLSVKQVLETETRALKTENSKMASYEKNVKERLAELASIVEAATSLEVLTAEGAKAAVKVPNPQDGGLGGSEIECEGQACDFLGAPPEEELTPGDAIPSLEVRPDGQNLVEMLDRYIDALKLVPLGIPGIGHVNSDYGYRRSPFSGRMTMHEGIDISLSAGSYIYATADGVISDVGRNSTYGLMIDVKHGPGVVSRYAHLSKVLVSEGEKICRGEVIGLVGSSGHSTGPHLHYEVRINGRARNPKPYIEIVSRLRRLIS